MVDRLKEGKDPSMTATIAAAAVATDRAEGEAGGGTVPAIRAQGLTKHYRKLTAVAQLTMQVSTGVVAGFIGLNGAGKTTTIRMLLGLIRPGDGAAEVLGRAVSYPAAYLHQVGTTIEGRAFCPTPPAATTDTRGDAHD